MTKPVPADETPEQRGERNVNAYHAKARAIALRLAEKTRTVRDREGNQLETEDDVAAQGKAADIFLAIAKQKADNAGLAKRHAQKVEAHVSGPNTTDAWLAKKAAEDNDDG